MLLAEAFKNWSSRSFSVFIWDSCCCKWAISIILLTFFPFINLSVSSRELCKCCSIWNIFFKSTNTAFSNVFLILSDAIKKPINKMFLGYNYMSILTSEWFIDHVHFWLEFTYFIGQIAKMRQFLFNSLFCISFLAENYLQAVKFIINVS